MSGDLKQNMQRCLDLAWASNYQEISARCHRNFVKAQEAFVQEACHWADEKAQGGKGRDSARYWSDQHRHFAFMARYWLFKAMGVKQESPHDA